MRRIEITLPKQEITIKMNKQIKEQFQNLNCTEIESKVLNRYKNWLNKSKTLSEFHLQNYKTLTGKTKELTQSVYKLAKPIKYKV